MNSNQKLRARIVLGGIVVAACGLVVTLYSTQITHGSSYIAKANKQYDRPGSNLFDRGTIFLSGKDDSHPAAATLTSTYIISMTPKLITDAQGAYEALSHYMDLDRGDFLGKVTLIDDPYEEIAHVSLSRRPAHRLHQAGGGCAWRRGGLHRPGPDRERPEGDRKSVV